MTAPTPLNHRSRTASVPLESFEQNFFYFQ